MSAEQAGIQDTPFDAGALLRRVEAGWRPEYLFFWGHQAFVSEKADKHTLSQWWESDFEIGQIRYSTAEHYMMAEKARLFGDDAALAKILDSRSPPPRRLWGGG